MSTNNLPRVTQKIFAGEAPSDQLVVFGTAKTGTPVISSDIATLQNNPAYTQGYQDAVLSDYAPFLPETNALHYIETRQLAYLFQHGLPEWDTNTVYFKDSCFCSYKGHIYKSIVDDNIGLEPDMYPQQWQDFSSARVSWGEIAGNIANQTDLQEQLANKSNIDLSNSTVPHIVDTYTNGASGYFVWSNGYCMQWGGNAGNQVPTKTVVNLIKTYRDTNYNLVVAPYTPRSVLDSFCIGVSGKTVSSFDTFGASRDISELNSFEWRTIGLLPEGEY